MNDTNPIGLADNLQSDWPTTTAAEAAQRPIERLVPKSELHARVLEHLRSRINMSEREMSKFYGRWRSAEAKVQAYVHLPDYEKEVEQANKEGKPPKPVSIVVPYTFATISTIVTYMIHTFTGRKPMFQVSSYKTEAAEAATRMETLLQYNADHTQLIKHLFQYFTDGEIYGVGVLRTAWKQERNMRSVWVSAPKMLHGLPTAEMERKRVRQERITYEGNDVSSIDPFMFFPDPRVPMHEVAKRGEFVAWRSFEGLHTLLREQAAGRLMWVNEASKTLPRNEASGMEGSSGRSLLSGGTAIPGYRGDNSTGMKSYLQVDQISCEIIPHELGLGDSTVPEKWLFTLLNKNQIVQAERQDNDHGMHPVAVIEPYSLGYGFGQPGIVDYLGKIQDTLSWLVDSHMFNVRAALNNMFIVDPSMVEMSDLLNPDAGKIIRLKRAAYGQDVRSALQQIAVQDVTRGHVQDMQLFMKLGDALSSVTDNIRGIQDSGGRKTATEVRTGAEAAASRLAAHCRLVSAQGVTMLTEQMSLNIQQYMSEEFSFTVLGDEGQKSSIRISPESIVGDFFFPVNDGTLPIDRVAMLDVWREILMGVAQDQQLRSQFDIGEIFEHVATLGGAKNIDRFRVQTTTQSPEAIAQGVQSGNLAPISGASGIINALGNRPSARMAGGF